MGFMEPTGFATVILPQMSMRDARCLAISSPAVSPLNFFNKLQQITYPNSKRKLCLTVYAALCCPRCKKRNMAAECEHYNSMIPFWISSDSICLCYSFLLFFFFFFFCFIIIFITITVDLMKNYF